MTKNCPKCNRIIDDGDIYCRYCGINCEWQSLMYVSLDCPLHNLFFRFFYMSCMPPSPILISCGLRECFVLLIFITDNFLLSMVGSSFRRMIPSTRNSEMPSLERSEEPNGSSDVITEVHFAVSKTFIM